MSSATEQVVLLAEDGTAIGTAAKAGVHTADTPLHLAFSCYVFDEGGRLLLTQRAVDKPTWGGVWTNSCCGHPAPGEDLTDTVHRRVEQELGLTLHDVTLVLPAFRYRAVMANGVVENELCPVFVATSPDAVAPDPSEVEAYEWVDWAAFRSDVLGGIRDVSPWCVDQVTALPADPRAEPTTYAAIALAVFLGSAAQSLVGLGIGLFSAPVITLLEPWAMPGTLIMLALVLPAVTLVRDHDQIDWPGLNWSLPSRLVGTLVGVWVVAEFSHRQLGVAVGAIVLFMVLITWRVVDVPITRSSLRAAGFVGGVTGTATSIGGPPFALLYQHRSAQQIRTTMAVYFLIGAGLSLLGLVASDDLTGAQLRAALELAPAMLLGALAGALSRRWLPASLVRPALLVVSAASALVLLVRSATGG